MTQPPSYRPAERFWPYADLSEQPSDEELAALDPDGDDPEDSEGPPQTPRE